MAAVCTQLLTRTLGVHVTCATAPAATGHKLITFICLLTKRNIATDMNALGVTRHPVLLYMCIIPFLLSVLPPLSPPPPSPSSSSLLLLPLHPPPVPLHPSPPSPRWSWPRPSPCSQLPQECVLDVECASTRSCVPSPPRGMGKMREE